MALHNMRFWKTTQFTKVENINLIDKFVALLPGKTQILYRLVLGSTIAPTPTIGFNVETLVRPGVHMVIWDVGGNEKVLHLWRNYTAGAQGKWC